MFLKQVKISFSIKQMTLDNYTKSPDLKQY